MGKEHILGGKHKILERGTQPLLVLGAEVPRRGSGTDSSGLKMLCLLALNLLSIHDGICWGAEVRPSSVLHLSLESKGRGTLVPPPSPLYGCCALPALGLLSSHQF